MLFGYDKTCIARVNLNDAKSTLFTFIVTCTCRMRTGCGSCATSSALRSSPKDARDRDGHRSRPATLRRRRRRRATGRRLRHDRRPVVQQSATSRLVAAASTITSWYSRCSDQQENKVIWRKPHRNPSPAQHSRQNIPHPSP